MTYLSNDNEDLVLTDIYVLSSVTIIKFYYRHKVEAIVHVQEYKKGISGICEKRHKLT